MTSSRCLPTPPPRRSAESFSKNLFASGARPERSEGPASRFNEKIILPSRFALILIAASTLLNACITIGTATEPAGTPVFVTSTLPPTKQILGLPSRTPTDRPGTPGTPTKAVTAPANCKDQAVLLEDVTIPDDTEMEPGESFTKTWKLQNTGSCPWSGYSLVFADGDRMDAPDSVPVPQTLASETVDISVDLVAPLADGAYTGNFSLHNVDDEIVPIGTEDSMWVKIIVGDAAAPTTTGNAAPAGGSSGGATCSHTTSSAYVTQILSLINGARANAGVPALTVNAQLTAAAQAHSVDLGCSDLTGHVGSDGSTVYERLTAAGYSPSSYEEIVYAGGGPQAAFDWWMNDAIHRRAILNPQSSQVGIGYASVGTSTYGDYITVDFASP